MFGVPEAFGREEPLKDFTFDTNFPEFVYFQFFDP